MPIDVQPIVEACRQEVSSGAFPGAAFAVGDLGRVAFGYCGDLTYEAGSPAAGPETLYDLASLTKILHPVATAMLLHQDGRLDLDARAVDIFPEFTGLGMETLTIRHLLRHDSGFPAYLRIEEDAPTPQEASSLLLKRLHEPLDHLPGTATVYSCLNAIQSK
jgi:CubicO group peptidase (beta-lactamase class C family)